MISTRSSFMAQWGTVRDATGYRLDVSTSRSFNSYVTGYENLDVGSVTLRVVSGLSAGSTYYYRVKAYSAAGLSGPSDLMTGTTTSGSGLVINATFDSSITNNANSASIQSTINQAIAVHESLFSDPITVFILFRYSNTKPDGSPIGNVIAGSNKGLYDAPWDTFLTALRSDAKTANDATANASLPANALSAKITVSSANGRAIGAPTPPFMFEDGSVASGGPYDGIVTLNSTAPLGPRPHSPSYYDAQTATEHEIDEILGLGSYLGHLGSDLRPQDLFSWSASGTRNISSSGQRYFSINSGTTYIVDFNQDPTYDFGDWLSDPCPQSNPYVQNAFGCPGQMADVTATSPEGINLDVIGYDLVTGSSARPNLLNISTRLRVFTGENVLIGGFIITGTAPKKVIIRAIGPSLTQAGLSDLLADPVLELKSGSSLITSNDNWKDTQETEIQASGVAPLNNFESAIVATLPPAAYTAIVSGKNATLGVGLVEVYDLNQAADSKLANISTRGLVQTGSNVMIGGFILGGESANAHILVRAIGPSLSSIAIRLADPTLELRDANGGLIRSNDNWKDSQQAEIQATTIPPTNDLESAIVTSLPPGAFTAIVAGKNGTSGVGLVEVYNLQ
ncbi:MAG: NF038122 family metalloprotease [Chthoniobacterales bacterium]